MRARYQYDPNRLQLTSLMVAQSPDAGCSLAAEKLYFGYGYGWLCLREAGGASVGLMVDHLAPATTRFDSWSF
ncbi:hypothetical protein [Bryobacter aggregatus]|uniref:hypothetical protein n=1 Tax=Bryobacter aggregatus TaxID=360054 RepID=UPI0004E229FA|nr:hypothetical protein [Bryobacter aggregatus]